MKKYLVIGNPIEHSLSPLIHNHWINKYRLFGSIYEKRKLEEKDLKNLIKEIRNDEISGANVTVPFKKLIIPFLDELDSIAKSTGSVNTICKVRNKIVGFNTDQLGFSLTIRELFLPKKESVELKTLAEKNIFILGAGGVTSSIICAVESQGGRIYLSNRTKKRAEEIKEKYKRIEILEWGERPPLCDIVVNTTSIGLKSDDKLDLDFSDCNGDKTKLFYDLIYNPKETNFLKEARLRGNKTINGQKMFLYQAMHAFKIWTNITPEIDDEVIKLLD